jgi:hypothetical protein|tara:strand:- start:470 stop:940 length:471 start_codon:yes stop_codon:yes gene_type:complete
MAFKDVSYTVGQKLSSTALNNNYSNFQEILTAPETSGQTSPDPFFRGRPVKTAYFYGSGSAVKIFGENISSVTYPSAGTYQINYTIPYQTGIHAINFQGVQEVSNPNSIENRNFQFGCQSQTTSESTIYWRISDSGNTDVGQAKFGVLVGYPSNGI